MKNKDLQIGLILLVIFIVLFAVSFTFQISALHETHTSAAFFPRIVLIIGMGLTLILIIQNILKRDASLSRKALDRGQRIRVLGSMGLGVLFGLGAVFIGTYVSLFLLIAAIMILWGVRSMVVILLNALLTPLFVYLIFTKLFLVQFPSGILF